MPPRPAEESKSAIRKPVREEEPFPQEFWFLRSTENGNLIRASDCAGDPICLYRSYEDAIAGMDSCKEMYDIDCMPVVVK